MTQSGIMRCRVGGRNIWNLCFTMRNSPLGLSSPGDCKVVAVTVNPVAAFHVQLVLGSENWEEELDGAQRHDIGYDRFPFFWVRKVLSRAPRHRRAAVSWWRRGWRGRISRFGMSGRNCRFLHLLFVWRLGKGPPPNDNFVRTSQNN
jgi:hypothetical protein